MGSVRHALIASALAGCYGATPPLGAPCNPSAPVCPTGQVCTQRGGDFVCTNPGGGDLLDGGGDGNLLPDDDANSDTDGDGVMNATDNCPIVPNAMQYNEDADTFGDACDVCPPHVDNTDGDSDGVGDQCDPNPGTSGEQIVLFEGFTGAIPTGWTANGTWATSNGALTTVGDDTVRTLVVPVTRSARQTLYTQLQITALSQGSGGGIGVVDGFNATPNVGLQCGGARSLGEYLAIVDHANTDILASTGHPMDVGTMYRLRFTRVDNDYTCSDLATSQSVNEQQGTTGTYVGFRNRVASGSFAYLLLVRSP